MNRMNKINIFYSLLIFCLISCRIDNKYIGKWEVKEGLFYGMSMEIQRNGDVSFFDIPEVKSEIFFDYNGDVSTFSEIISTQCKEVRGLFDKQTSEILVPKEGIEQIYKVLFSDGKILELQMDNGCMVIFEK